MTARPGFRSSSRPRQKGCSQGRIADLHISPVPVFDLSLLTSLISYTCLMNFLESSVTVPFVLRIVVPNVPNETTEGVIRVPKCVWRGFTCMVCEPPSGFMV